MRKEVNPAIVAAVIVAALGFAVFMLWRFAERKRPADAVSARQMLSDPKVQNAVMDRYKQKYGGGGAP